MRAPRDVPVILLVSAACACTTSQEAARVELPVEVDGSRLTDTVNDLGYAVHLETARLAIGDVEFTISGEMHGATASLWRLLVPTAWAHPGHYAGGDVTGVLTGPFVLDWLAGDGVALGDAELIVGDYNGCNINLRRADELPDGDPLRGHTAFFAGVAGKDGASLAFTAALDVDDGVQVVGATFEDTVAVDSTGPLRLQLVARDQLDGDTLFDGLDFAALDDDGDGTVTIVPGDAAHNIFRRALPSHAFYSIIAP
jgi:hypothetical protein